MVDYLIIGQGLAGSVVAWKLLKAGKSIFVINNTLANQASQVAAGQYNPVSGRNLAVSWLAEQIFPVMESFYQEIENNFSIKLLYAYPLFRPFLCQEDRARYLADRGISKGAAYIELLDPTCTLADFWNPYGGLIIRQAGYVDLPCFLASIRSYLQKLGCYQEHQFIYEKLKLNKYNVKYQAIEARSIIFCDGVQVRQNPFFSFLPFSLVKGELLTIALEKSLDKIYNRSIYIVPNLGQHAIVGSTYDWEDLSIQPTSQAREKLEKALKERFKIPYHLVCQKAGIRPATFDRRPFIGIHPNYPQMSIFNGLGTKGVSLCPYLADRFVTYLLGELDLPNEVKIGRLARKNKQ
jgi:glycine/D-amino acid oxidase-like deaminating enzyme